MKQMMAMILAALMLTLLWTAGAETAAPGTPREVLGLEAETSPASLPGVTVKSPVAALLSSVGSVTVAASVTVTAGAVLSVF